jgi:hypothetical protein
VRIAILIVGEYRTFAQCRKTMLFLNEPGVDIYVSTWNKTNTVNPSPLQYSDSDARYIPVTEEQIRKDIEIENVTCAIHEPIPIERFDIYPSIIESWTRGFSVLKESGKTYDYVLMTRPDLFFNDNSYFLKDMFNNYTNSLGVRSPPTNSLILDDTVYFSTFYNIERIMTNIKSHYKALLDSNGSFKWHVFLYDFIVENLKLTPISLPFAQNNENVIARFPMGHDNTFDEVNERFWELFRKNNQC